MDITTVFSAIILWLIFGFFSPLLNCNLQHLLTKNVFAKHIGCIICVFFLIAVFVAPPTQELGVTWIQTLILYVFFIMATKSKLFPIIVVLVLLVIDQSIRLEIERRLALDPDADVSNWNKARTYLLYIIAILIVMGCAWYYVIKYQEYGESFSNVTFFFGSNSCKSLVN